MRVVRFSNFAYSAGGLHLVIHFVHHHAAQLLLRHGAEQHLEQRGDAGREEEEQRGRHERGPQGPTQKRGPRPEMLARSRPAARGVHVERGPQGPRTPRETPMYYVSYQ